MLKTKVLPKCLTFTCTARLKVYLQGFVNFPTKYTALIELHADFACGDRVTSKKLLTLRLAYESASYLLSYINVQSTDMQMQNIGSLRSWRFVGERASER